HKVELRLNTRLDASVVRDEKFDEIVISSGVKPRPIELAGFDSPKVVDYQKVLNGEVQIGQKVALIGAGGIGFDMAHYLCESESSTLDLNRWLKQWGIDKDYKEPGGLTEPVSETEHREVYLLQRKATKMGKGLGKTTGWIHRSVLKQHEVSMKTGVSYEKFDDQGLHIKIDGQDEVLDVDNVILCAGQVSNTELVDEMKSTGIPVHLIGGVDVAAELDAKRAIRQGAELAIAL
ncbi:FAD-dependent oxidoreductase, partial [Shewanella sp. 0m-11]